MKQKIIKLVVFVVFVQLFFYACCSDDYNVFITSIALSAKDDLDEDTTNVANENFNLEYNVDYYVEMASLLSKKSGVINTAYASISCDEHFTNVKLVSTITLTANVPLFGIPAGESLNDHVIVEHQFNQGELFDMHRLWINTNHSHTYLERFLRFDTEIPSTTTVQFTMTAVFENNQVISSTTNEITFE